jgi:hypothetical protein
LFLVTQHAGRTVNWQSTRQAEPWYDGLALEPPFCGIRKGAGASGHRSGVPLSRGCEWMEWSQVGSRALPPHAQRSIRCLLAGA